MHRPDVRSGWASALFPRQLLVDGRLQRLPVLDAAEGQAADNEQRHAAHADLLVGVPEDMAMRLTVLAASHRFLEFLLIESDLASLLRQYANVADVLPLDEECLQDPMVVPYFPHISTLFSLNFR